MSEHKAIIRWTRDGPDFLKGKYSREHTWRFDGGLSVRVNPVKIASTACVMLLIFCSCGQQYPSRLQSIEQIQVVVLEHVSTEFLGGQKSTSDEAIRLFVSTGQPFADPPKLVLDWIAKSFRSVRPYSAATTSPQSGEIVERATGKKGVIVWIAPFSPTSEGPLVIKAGYRVDGRNAETFEYRVQRIDRKWKILGRKLYSVS